MMTFAPTMTWFPADTERGLTSQDDSGELHLDFQHIPFITPYVLAITAVLAHFAQTSGAPARFTTPARDEVARYASRMHLGEVLSSCGVDHSLPPVRESDQTDRLCELQSFSTRDPAACERLAKLMAGRCDNAGIPARITDDLAAQVYEVCNNAYAHAECDHAYLCAQTYSSPQGGRLEFVVADGGRGVRASLVGTEHAQPTDELAIRAAVERRTSAIGRPHHHGIGLANLREFSTTSGGSMTIRSGTALVSFRSGGTTESSTATPLSGTAVSCSLPLQTSRSG